MENKVDTNFNNIELFKRAIDNSNFILFFGHKLRKYLKDCGEDTSWHWAEILTHDLVAWSGDWKERNNVSTPDTGRLEEEVVEGGGHRV